MKRHCLALDLKDDPILIKEYEAYHRSIWPEIAAGIKESGIENLAMYRTGNRLFMVMDVNDDFSFSEKNATDAADPIVQEWEALMWNFQQALPWAKPGEKWVMMDKIFDLQ